MKKRVILMEKSSSGFLRRFPLVHYSTRLDREPRDSRCYVIVEECDSGGTGNCGVCRFESLLVQRCGETGGVGLGVFGAEPAVNRQLLLENAFDLPTVERLVLLLLHATAAERSTLDTALFNKRLSIFRKFSILEKRVSVCSIQVISENIIYFLFFNK